MGFQKILERLKVPSGGAVAPWLEKLVPCHHQGWVETNPNESLAIPSGNLTGRTEGCPGMVV